MTSVQPPGRFGSLNITNGKITGFKEKPNGEGGWINGGFFVLSPRVMDYIEGDGTTWERQPLEKLASEGQLSAFKHEGFWRPMDTLRDKVVLEESLGPAAKRRGKSGNDRIRQRLSRSGASC